MMTCAFARAQPVYRRLDGGAPRISGFVARGRELHAGIATKTLLRIGGLVMRTIVVGVDGSEPSLRALRFAADLAADLDDAELVVVFARYIYLSMPEQAAEDMYGDVLAHAERLVRQEADKILDERGVRWKFLSRFGEPAAVLCAMAEELGASFVIAGRRGWSTTSEILLGSVSNRLVHRAHCPVLLVND
jgi:nucleotide-binding universal stress UspA family protein